MAIIIISEDRDASSKQSRCLIKDCKNIRYRKKSFCRAHTGEGRRRCNSEGCTNIARRQGACKIHGGGTICKFAGCKKYSQSCGVCWDHGGKTKCIVEDCNIS